MPLTGDASDRRYLRLILDGTPSIVLALHAGAIEYATLPFVRVAALLGQVPLPVPRLLHHDDGLGIIGLQDLGDVTLQAHLGETTATERALRYRQAVGLIARLQQRGGELASDAYPPYAVAFDVEKLTWELEFFVKHFLLAFRGVQPTEPVRAALREEWAAIAGELAAEPRVLCHRDYHSRNLMWHDEHALRHRLPGRADGPRHLRPGLAAARFLRRSARCRRRRPDRLLHRPDRAAPPRRHRATSGSGGGST